MKYNDEIVGSDYEIREIIILNWIKYFTSDDREREDMRANLQLYLQQEIWRELEGGIEIKYRDVKKIIDILEEENCKMRDTLIQYNIDEEIWKVK